MKSRYELINKHREAFEAFAKAGVDPTRHSGWVSIYEEKSRHKNHRHVAKVAEKFNCSPRTVHHISNFLKTEI